MAEKKIGAKIVIDGESEFRASMISAKKALDNFDSELNKINKTYKNNANSLEALRAKQQVYTKLQEEQTHKVSLLTEMQDKAVKKLEEEQYTLTALSNRRELLNQRLEEAKKTYGENSDEVQNLNKELEDINKQYTEQERVVQKTNDKVNNYQTQLNNAEAELSDLNSEIEQNDKYLNEAENSTDGCAKSIDEYGNEVKDASKETSIFSEVLKAELLSSAIKEGLKALAEGIKNIATAATETGMQFESSMSQVAATMGITTKEIAEGSKSFEILTKAAQDCGKSTMFSASQAGEALNYLALAGYDAEKAAATLPKVLNLAAAGGLDLAYASDLVTDSMAALGMETSDLDNYIDQMAKTSQKSNTSVAQLGEATLVCAGAVKLAEQDINTMNTVLGVLANNGIKGAEGGTHLRNIILSLSSPTDNAATAMKELGLEIEDSNGSMRNLEDIIIDMNDAMSQLSSVEKTKMISKIFNKTDIGAVNALLKSTNGEFKNLKSQIKDCSGAAQEMADTLNDNLKGKITILQSALEGLGITTYDLFDDTMKSAVDSATDAVGRLQDSIDNGDLGVSLRNMSDALGEFAEKALGTAEDAVPKLIDGLTWILENGEILASLIGGITTAKITYTVATKAATVAQEVFNLTCNANPYIMLATAIGGIVSAIAIYSATADEAGKKLSDSTEKIVNSSKKLTEESKKAAKERADTKAEYDAQREACEKLVDELDALRNKTSLTAEEQTREKAIIDELNTAFPELNLFINEQTGEINLSTDAIMQNIDAQLALMKVEAAREDLTQIAKEQYEEEKKLAELMSEKEEAANRLAEAEKNLTDVQEAMREGWGARADLEEANQVFEIATNDVNELSNSIEESNNRISELKSEYEATTQYIADNNQVYEETANALDGLGDAADSTGDAIVAMSDEAVEAYNKMYEGIYNNIDSQMKLFDEFTAKCDLSTDRILKNMESQVKGVTEWSENLKTLGERGINQGLLQYLADMGPQGAGYVAQFVKMTDEELQKANDLYKESIEAKATSARDITETWYEIGQESGSKYGEGIESGSENTAGAVEKVITLPDTTATKMFNQYREAGLNASKGLQEGITEGTDNVNKAAEELSQGTLDTVETTLDEHSPSKKTEKIGEYFDEGLKIGINKNKDKIMDVIKKTTSEMLVKTKDGIPDKYREIGEQIVKGLENGIKNSKSELINTVIDLCETVITTTKETLDIHSPSKRTEELGEATGEGYIKGYKTSMEGIDDVVAEALPDIDKLYGGLEQTYMVVNTLEEEYKKAMSEIKDNNDINQITEALKKFGDSALILGVDIGTMSKETLDAYQKMYEGVSGSISSQMNLFSEYKLESKISTEELLHNMNSQITGVAQWATNLDTLANRGINQGLLQYLADMGPQGAEYVQAFTKMSDEELQRANELFKVSLMLPDTTAANIVNSYNKAGLNASKGLQEGITEGTDNVNKAAEELSQGTLDTVETTLDEHSPSKKTEKMGEYFDEGLKIGINKNKDKIMDVIKKITSEMLTKTKEGIPENYHNIGIQITEGLKSGIEAGRSAVIEAMRTLCIETIQTAKSTLDINSPSKKFEYLGEMSGQGYITGWEQTMQNIDSIIMDTLPDLPSGSKNNVAGAQAATKTILPDNLINKMEQQNANILDVCNKMQTMIAKYMPQMANMQIVTNTGALIGELMPGLDNEFGNMKTEKERGVL